MMICLDEIMAVVCICILSNFGKLHIYLQSDPSICLKFLEFSKSWDIFGRNSKGYV